ncbi:MAG TPA: hypothetical protein VGA99_15085, partial [bacterium]
MTKLPRSRMFWVCLLIGSAFILTGCYTQLAKPEAQKVDREYYEDEPEYAEEGTGEEQVVEGAESEDTGYAEENVDRIYYHDIHYYGYYGTPWWFDPFYDPYYYDYYSPYSSHVSVHIGYYDPFYFNSYYYPFSYRHRPYYWGFGCYRPSRGYFYPYYSGGYTNVNTIPYKQRGFNRRGTEVQDDLGYRPGRIPV